MKSLIFRCSLALGITAGALSVVSCSDPGSTYLPASDVFVIGSSSPATVQIYPISGAASPGYTSLTLPTGYQAVSITTDVYGSIYVGVVPTGSGTPAVLVFANGASGAATPVRTILLTPATYAWDMATDTSGQLYIATQSIGLASPQVNVFARGATGAATPVRTVQLTDVTQLTGFAVDDSGAIYAAGTYTTSGIGVYAPTVRGGTASTRVLLFSAPVYGVAADDSGDIYTQTAFSGTGSAAIEEFGPTANGSAPSPINTIQLPVQSATSSVGGLVRLDRTGNLFTSLGLVSSSTLTVDIDAYTPGSSGDGTPGLSFTPNITPGDIFAVN
jgi:hypothetical protein